MRYRTPEKLKETGVEWLGEIPEEWNTPKIKWLFKQITSGSTPSSTNKKYYDGGSIPWVQTGDLNDAVVNETSKKITKSALTENSALKLFPEKTLLIAMYGATIGKLGMLQCEAATNQACCALIKPTNTISEFIFYWLLGKRKEIVSLAYGGGQPNISQDVVKNLRLGLPPIGEQHAIAAFLDRKTEAIDDLIQKKEQLIERLKEKRQALITRAVTKGLKPDAPMKDSGIEWLGEIPEEWDLVKFKHIVYLISDSIEDSEFSIALENIESWTGDYVETDSNYTASGTMFKEGDVLFGKLRPYLAKVYLAKQEGKAIGDIYVFRGKKVIFKYLFMIVASKAFIDIVNSSTYGAKMPRASWDFIGEIKLPIPDTEKQEEIVNEVESQLNVSYRLVNKIDAEIQKLKEYRQSLISAAVTGKIDVRDEIEVIQSIKTKEYDIEDASLMFMYFVDECYRRQAFFGRLMAVKNYFLLHYILEINPQLAHFKRLPKGPHDPEFWDRLENLLVEKGWISIEEPNKEKKNVKYMPNRSIEYKSVLKEQFGDGWETVQKVVNEMADKDSQHAEVLATVYAAWNDLMIFGKEPSEEKILNEVLNHWPGEEKQKIPESAWRRGIKKLERLGIAPAGFGKPTRDQMKLL